MNVKELREKKGLTQAELSDKSGIPRDRIAKWEQGKGSPKAKDEKILLGIFGEVVHNRPVSEFETHYERISDYKDEYIGLLKEENQRIKKRQAESLDVMREVLLMNQAILKTLRNSVAQLIAKQEKSDVLEVAHRLDKETAEFYNLAEKGSRT